MTDSGVLKHNRGPATTLDERPPSNNGDLSGRSTPFPHPKQVRPPYCPPQLNVDYGTTIQKPPATVKGGETRTPRRSISDTPHLSPTARQPATISPTSPPRPVQHAMPRPARRTHPSARRRLHPGGVATPPAQHRTPRQASISPSTSSSPKQSSQATSPSSTTSKCSACVPAVLSANYDASSQSQRIDNSSDQPELSHVGLHDNV